MRPLISVCLPVFNGSKHLSEAIESVLAQTYTNFELLVSDDCSEDSSWEIVQHYAQRDRRIIAWRNQSRLGLFSNYNLCMRRASGELVKPFAQDDVLEPAMLGRCLKVFHDHGNVVLVATDRCNIDEQSRVIPRSNFFCHFSQRFPVDAPVAGIDIIKFSLFPVINVIGEPACVMFNRTLIGDGFDTGFYHLGDLEYWLRILTDGDFYFCSDTMCKFRVHSGSQTAKNAKSLLHALDHVRLGRKCAWLIDSLGCSEQEYMEYALATMSDHLQLMVDSRDISAAQLRAQRPLIAELYSRIEDPHEIKEAMIADLMGYRELAFHAMRMISRLSAGDTVEWLASNTASSAVPRPTSHSYSDNTHDHLRAANDRLEENQQRIAALEFQLGAILASRSWRVTAFCRDIWSGAETLISTCKQLQQTKAGDRTG